MRTVSSVPDHKPKQTLGGVKMVLAFSGCPREQRAYCGDDGKGDDDAKTCKPGSTPDLPLLNTEHTELRTHTTHHPEHTSPLEPYSTGRP